MKNIITLFFMAALLSITQAQITFQKTYGGGMEGKCHVVNTSDGGYAIAGSTQSFGAGGTDVYLVRTDVNGTLLWTKTYGGTGSDVANAIEQTSDSGFIITGSTASFGAGDFDVYLIRTDKNGDTLWTRTFGNTLDEDGWSVQQTTDGGFIVVGDYGSSGYDYMIKTDAGGDTLWTKIYDQGKAFSVIQNQDNGYAVCGAVYSFISNGNDMFLYRTDSLGNVLWYRTYGGSNVDYAYQVLKANDGGFIVLGYTVSFGAAGTVAAYVVKTDSLGNLVWSKIYSGPGINFFSSIASTGDGYALLCPVSLNVGNSSYGLLIRIDNSGNIIWAKNFPACASGNVLQTADGGLVLSGYSGNFYLVKTDSAGNSGCNDTTALVTDSTPPTQVDTIVPNQIFGTIVGIPPTEVSSGGTETSICAATGIKDDIAINSPGIKVYPNPTSGEFNIKPEGNQNFSVELYNVWGERVYESALENSETVINLNAQAAGMYFIDVRMGQSVLKEKVLIVK